MPVENDTNTTSTATADGGAQSAPAAATPSTDQQRASSDSATPTADGGQQPVATPSAADRRQSLADAVKAALAKDAAGESLTAQPDPASGGPGQATPSSKAQAKTTTDSARPEAATTKGKAADPGQLKAARGFLEGIKQSPKPDTGEDQVVQSARDTARDVLKRNQWDDDEIDNLPDDKLYAKAAKLYSREQESARVYSELSGLKKGNPPPAVGGEAAANNLTAAQTADSRQQTPASNDGSPPPALTDRIKARIGEILQPLQSEENVDAYGDLVTPLSIGFTSLAEEIASDFQAQLGQTVESLTKAFEQQWHNALAEIDDVRLRHEARLPQYQEQFPELNEPENFAKVASKVRQLANLNGYHDKDGNPLWDRLLTEAANSVLGNPHNLQKTQARMLDEQKTMGQNTGRRPNAHQVRRPGSITNLHDAVRHAIPALEAGKSADQVAAELRQAS